MGEGLLRHVILSLDVWEGGGETRGHIMEKDGTLMVHKQPAPDQHTTGFVLHLPWGMQHDYTALPPQNTPHCAITSHPGFPTTNQPHFILLAHVRQPLADGHVLPFYKCYPNVPFQPTFTPYFLRGGVMRLCSRGPKGGYDGSISNQGFLHTLVIS